MHTWFDFFKIVTSILVLESMYFLSWVEKYPIGGYNPIEQAHNYNPVGQE